MNVAVLFSGGKDSVASTYISIKKGHKIKCLVTIIPENPESYMFHYPNIGLTCLQAEAMGIRHITRKSKGEKEKELGDLEAALRPLKKELEGVVAGGLASRYQAERIRGVCKKLGLKFLAPLWNINPDRYWNMLLKSGFKVMITGVYSQGLGGEWLGRVIDTKALEELRALSRKFRFNLSGEGGEFETLVLDCPLFKKSLKILKAEKIWEKDSGFYRIDKAELV